MGLVSSLLMLPLAPVRGVVWLAEVIQERVEHELHDPAKVRREMEAIDEAAAAGELSDEERRQAQQQVLDRLIRPRESTSPPAGEE
ncbi:gas vesicle protein GvpG [Nocardia higoensis]|uniref:Gas vesicle protein GvpG n=1 Tax=Nocardia higoensis TaxID=228599 RepID=A0ABS0DHA4_9NOCA|nr:gas vesicle protein GvpG [Nocardia higoensis]MBF6357826.1 gas vesicle protein GvpG [Nocardia higoensis]